MQPMNGRPYDSGAWLNRHQPSRPATRLSEAEFRSLLAVMMCADPHPWAKAEAEAASLLDSEARIRGFEGWLDAYRQNSPGYTGDRPVDGWRAR